MKSLMVCSVVLCGHILLAGRASFKVIALDSGTGQPIPNVKIEGSFLNYSPGWGVAAKNNDVDAWTDRNGVARLSGNTEKGVGGYRIYRTPGYYNAEWAEIAFSEQSFLKLGRWLPDDIVVTARLDRIMNPVPLFVKKSTGKFREKKQWYYFQDADYKEISKLSATNDVPIIKGVVMSYDFFKAFIFNETCYGWEVVRGGPGVSAYKRFRMDVSVVFPGMGNGMVEVPHVLNAGINLRTATQDGYGNKMTCWYGRFFGERGEKTNCNKSRCYAFRIRTVYDEGGNIKSAYYGKIYGDFDMTGLDGVRFLYYLNPTPNDRNLEWDMKNNLCPNPGDIGNPRP